MKFRLTVLSVALLVIAPRAQGQDFRLDRPAAPASGAVRAAATPGSPAGHDFATEVIGDPWDFEQATDYNLMFSLDAIDRYQSAWVGVPPLTNGVFTGVSQVKIPRLSLQFEGVTGAFNMASRNGVRYPIDANKYRRLSLRMRRSVPAASAEMFGAQWFTGILRGPASGGYYYALARGWNGHTQRYDNQMPLNQQGSGWQIYKIDLDRTHAYAGGQPWANVVRGIELMLGGGPGGLDSLINSTFELDWVRLTERGTATASLSFSGFGGAVTVTARHVETGDVIQIYPDNGSSTTTFADNSTYTWDYGFLPPGTWQVTSSRGSVSRTLELTIDAVPVFHLTEPDVSGGRDYATTVLGDPWDLTTASDVTSHGRLYDMTGATYGPNGLTATTLGPGGDAPGEGDSFVALLDASLFFPNEISIPADEYGRLTFALEHLDAKTLPASRALEDAWGSVYRVIWHYRDHGTGGAYSETLPIFMMDGGPQIFSLDLRTLTKTGPVEPSVEPTSPTLWTGDVSTLRIDVNEAKGVDRPFRLSAVKLARDDEPPSTGVFVVRWTVADATFSREVVNSGGSDATVALYFDTDTDPAGRALIASGVPASQGSYNWNVSSLPPGTYYVYGTVTDGGGNSQSRFSTGPVRVRGGYISPVDNDQDGMPDAWEARYGISSPTADEDGDGVSNVNEYANGTDPRLANRWTLAEGATGFFSERLALVNPNPEDASVNISFLKEAGSPILQSYTVPGSGRLTVDVNAVPGIGASGVSAVVNTVAGGVVVERTMFWGDLWYGGHTGKAVDRGRTRWYLAEGDAGFFDTFILLANPNTVAATVTLDFLLQGGGAPIRQTYQVGPNARVTVDTKQVPGLPGKSFSTTIDATQPINVERAMYFTNQGRFWNGGHEAAAIEAPATDWFVAEGRTGPMFDTYLLLANPGAQPVTATVRFLRPGGAPVVQTRSLAAQSRDTIWVDGVPGLADTDVSASISATGPIIVERAMYWPGDFTQWHEAHASAGVTATSTRWALAEGEYGGSRGFETYFLLANASASDAVVRVTLLRAGGLPPVSLDTAVAANSRVTLSAGQFAISSGEKFGAVVDSLNGVPIVVERAMYWNGGGVFWGGGTNETGVRLR